MDDIKIDLLTKKNLFLPDSYVAGSKDTRLNVIKKYGTKAAGTDLNTITGALLHTSYSLPQNIKNEIVASSIYWTKEKNGATVKTVHFNGAISAATCCFRTCSIRPILRLSEKEFNNIKSIIYYNYSDKVKEVLYGEYPQYVPYEDICKELEYKLNNLDLSKTGKFYIFDKTNLQTFETPFTPDLCPEYEYKGRKYIRIQPRFEQQRARLSNGIYYTNKDYVWVEVSSVIWLVDEKTKTLVSKRCLLSGVRFSDDFYDSIEKSDMNHYLKDYMLKDLNVEIKLDHYEIPESINNIIIESLEDQIKEDESLTEEELEILMSSIETEKAHIKKRINR